MNLIWKTAQKHITRGCPNAYRPRQNKENSELWITYAQLYDADPFGEEAIQTGKLLAAMTEARQKVATCSQALESTDVSQQWKSLEIHAQTGQ